MLTNTEVDLNIQDANGETPLIFAMKSRKSLIAKMLITSPCDIDFNLVDNNGNSFTHLLVESGNTDILS